MWNNLTNLERTLVEWAMPRIPAHVDAIDWREPQKEIAAIFRRIIRQSPGYLWQCVDTCPADLIALGPYIREIPCSDLGTGLPGSIPGRLGWRAWVESSAMARRIDFRLAGWPLPERRERPAVVVEVKPTRDVAKPVARPARAESLFGATP